ncbi:hypothetical protein BSK66_12545 [Paenibacillus odorifer]|uniref:Uncharacterized protein n=1 Tax=Paenibacillus odorifer TaxID=189426 RepID=A0A1R0XAH5_9BACL|nr:MULTISPECIES: hypothetical protein [Paenibacillus]ETT53910.1 hypothetical protein C171_20674 [Paenibacillus sp. FSL H8-237]OMD31926.1 hypothetical protein BJP51_16900 [Paenibacillus odorifer]OME58422.1 hypothetical protein BSK66_12545 [Paenibacillus odorifer]
MFNLLGEEEHKSIENELIRRHRILFSKYFNQDDELDMFIDRNLDTSKDNIQRRTINNVQRLVALADEMILVKPGKWDLAIFFFLSCVESIYTLNRSRLKKQEMIIDFFEKYVTDEEQDSIAKSIMIADESIPYDYKITRERFSLLLTSIRNQVAHEGVYWNLYFIQEESEERTPIMNSFLAKSDKNSPARKIIFTNKMKFSELRDIFIKGFIRFITQHESINSLNQ